MINEKIIIRCGSSNALTPIILAIADKVKQQQYPNVDVLEVELVLEDPFLDRRTWDDLLESIADALKYYIRTKQLSLITFRKIGLIAWVTNTGWQCETIWS